MLLREYGADKAWSVLVKAEGLEAYAELRNGKGAQKKQKKGLTTGGKILSILKDLDLIIFFPAYQLCHDAAIAACKVVSVGIWVEVWGLKAGLLAP